MGAGGAARARAPLFAEFARCSACSRPPGTRCRAGVWADASGQKKAPSIRVRPAACLMRKSLCRRCPRQPLHFSSAAGDAPGPCWGTHSLRSSIRSHFPHTQHRGAPVSLQGCTQMCQRAPGIGVGVFGGSCCAGGRRSAVCGPVRTGARACLSLRPRCRSALSAGAPQLQQRACCVRCASPGSSCWTLAGACEGQ